MLFKLNRDPTVPVNAALFGYGPMVLFVVAALGAWTLPLPWPGLATTLAIVWGALILASVGGVRRGYGFGDPDASTRSELIATISYFVPAGLALIAMVEGLVTSALALLIAGFWMVAFLNRVGAQAGDAPVYFARLRPAQTTIAIVSLLILLAYRARRG